jgi:hypothetical protein
MVGSPLVSQKFAKKKMKKRAARSPSPSSRGSYASKGVNKEVKEHTASFATALVEAGVPLSTIVSALQKTDYSPSERTLYLHIERVNKGQAPLSHEKENWRQATSHRRAMVGRCWLDFGSGKKSRPVDCAAMD